ncbi:PEPxxWA-CTERM sorting domain-containing protein [Parasphingorhabdus sp.]|uniref:PEPxxWA-CTERM sorting domain-containing protein n=1 Tax=Parasphingorhabdus sp. TaxID=2709688 RepID=UPI003264C2AB
MKKLVLAATAATMLTAVPAQAATILGGSLGVDRTASFQFDYDGTGNLSIQVDADLTSGTPLSDPQIYIFNDDYLTGTLFATDDDSGFGLNAFISQPGAAGTYVLQIGNFSFTEAEARANANNSGSEGDDFVVIFGDGIDNIGAPVPEPATWAFMIFGFGAVGSAMRRRNKANVKVSYA